jgi:hypothetical protein
MPTPAADPAFFCAQNPSGVIAPEGNTPLIQAAPPFFCAQNSDGVNAPRENTPLLDWNVAIDLEGFDKPTRKEVFALSRNRYMRQFHAVKADDKRTRRGIKKLVRPENAAELAEHLPEPGDCTHAVVRGDFVLADMIPFLLGDRVADILAISTLGMSRDNAAKLAEMQAAGQVRRLFLLVSHYFSRVDKTGTYREVKGILGDAVVVAHTHAKVILVSAAPSFFVVEGSANLRSCDSIEQFAIWNDEELLNWHLEWMQEVHGA